MESPYTTEVRNSESFGYWDEYIRNPIGDFSLTYNPLNLLPNPLDSDLTTFPSPEKTNFSSIFTGDDAAHVENLVYWGVDSPVLPPSILASLTTTVEAAPALSPMLPGLQAQPNTPSMVPFPPSPGSVGLTIALADLRGYTGSSSLTSASTESQQSTQGHLVPRPAKRAHTSYPGESSFRLDSTVPPLKQSESPGQSKNGPNVHPEYPLCRCPLGPTTRPSRHWDVCPSNPAGRKKPFKCEICGRAFTAKWNWERHVKSCMRKGF